MTRSLILRWLGLFFALLTLAAATGCKEGGGQKKDPRIDYYTCTMHPSVKSQKPGDK